MSKSKKITELDKLSNAKETDLIPVARDSEPNGDNSIAIGSIIRYDNENHILTILGRYSFDVSGLLKCYVTIEAENGCIKDDGVIITSKSYPYGSNLHLSAEADLGYRFVKWQINNQDLSTNQNIEYTVYESVTVKAVFEEQETVQITAVVADGQSDRGNAYIVVNGENYTTKEIEFESRFGVKAIANTNYEFQKWVINDNTELSDAEINNIPATEAAVFKAYFKYINIKVTVSPNDSTLGSISLDGISGNPQAIKEIQYNDSIILVAIPNSNRVNFVRWEIPLVETIGETERLEYQVNEHFLNKQLGIRAVFEHIGLYDFYYKTYNKPSQGYIVDGITSFDGMNHVDYEDLETETFEEFGTMKAVKGVANNNQVYVIFFDSSKFDKEVFMNENEIAFDVDNDFSDTDIYHCGTKTINNKTFGFIELVMERTIDNADYAVGFSTIQ